ncbi:MAG: ImmA/IrrE family metallo-endopeptidase [Deltaproteobacteria bacterium]|jgi:Zn-dependent peptidase ImmA (M78 family)/transcriptional regulator with XRE-family HTH domain|nr:ImmA/IrrE family metallo-endopeptidase [Deltaproteobacteria bacterium]
MRPCNTNKDHEAKNPDSYFSSKFLSQVEVLSAEDIPDAPIDLEEKSDDSERWRTIASNVIRLRRVKRLSQKQLAIKAGISLTKLTNLEKAASEPSYRTVQAVAEALEEKMIAVLRPVRPLVSVRFRALKKIDRLKYLHFAKENLLAKVSNWLDDYRYLEDLLDDKMEFKLSSILNEIEFTDPLKMITLAKDSRARLNLNPDEPINNIARLIEEAGVKIGLFNAPIESLFGFSVGSEDGGPAIIINMWDKIPWERRIFTTAHELAHNIFRFASSDPLRLEENDNEETMANIFASHFLMPNAAFMNAWINAPDKNLIPRVLYVKQIFKVSYITVLRRLFDNKLFGKGHNDVNIYKQFKNKYSVIYGKTLNNKEEIEPLIYDNKRLKSDQFYFQADRLKNLTINAVIKQEISFSRGAEILEFDLLKMRRLVKISYGRQSA